MFATAASLIAAGRTDFMMFDKCRFSQRLLIGGSIPAGVDLIVFFCFRLYILVDGTFSLKASAAFRPNSKLVHSVKAFAKGVRR